jgi:hypothetical protein
MSYRDEGAALRMRRETIASRLEEARRAAAEAWSHQARIAGLEQDLAAVDALLAEEQAASSASLLDNVRIASPCQVNWDDMIGDDRVRFCGQCTKNVYNLSALPQEDAEELLRVARAREAQDGEGVCVRFYRRADGTILTADCPDGARRKKRRLALFGVFGAVGAGLMAAGAAAELFGTARPMQGDISRTVSQDRQVTTMGAVAMPQLEASPVPAPTAHQGEPSAGPGRSGPVAGKPRFDPDLHRPVPFMGAAPFRVDPQR